PVPATSAISTLSLHDALPICRREEEPTELLLLPRGVERRALHHPHPRPDPNSLQIVHRGLADDRKARQWREIPGIESVRIPGFGDRKSTRLNSSHVSISYAVF